MTQIVLIPIIISSVSLLAAILTFYFTQARPSRISVLIGPEMQAYHADYPEMSTGIYIPMSFINTSPNMGTIFKCGVSIFKTDSPDERFFMLWREFSKTGTDGNWTHDGHAHSFAVAGKTSVNRVAWFMWFKESNPKLYFTKGRYTLVTHVWTGKNKKPKNTTFNFYISKEEELFFQTKIQAQSKNVIRILLNKDFDRNKLLTTHESKALFE